MNERTAGGGLRSALGMVAGACFVGGPLLAWIRIVPGLVGFLLFALGGLLGLVLGVLSLVQAVRGRGLGRGGVVALGVAAAFLLIAARGGGAPRINDFTTDLADPPTFTHAGTLAPNAGRDMGYPVDFAAIQRECCADLRPARLTVAPGEAFARAEQAARRNGWDVTWTDPSAGRLEAVATTRLFGFHDDIAIRVRPEGDGASRVDVRSKSRDGKGDMGTNAARIRAFVGSLEDGRGAPPS
jgi:uncharacterized protein DUF1499